MIMSKWFPLLVIRKIKSSSAKWDKWNEKTQQSVRGQIMDNLKYMKPEKYLRWDLCTHGLITCTKLYNKYNATVWYPTCNLYFPAAFPIYCALQEISQLLVTPKLSIPSKMGQKAGFKDNFVLNLPSPMASEACSIQWQHKFSIHLHLYVNLLVFVP